MEKIEQVLIDRFDALIRKLGEGAEAGWDIFVYQTQLEGYITIGVSFLFFVIFATMTIRYMNSKNHHEKVNYREYVDWELLNSIAMFISASLEGGAVIMIACHITKIFNPEYHALKHFLSLLR